MFHPIFLVTTLGLFLAIASLGTTSPTLSLVQRDEAFPRSPNELSGDGGSVPKTKCYPKWNPPGHIDADTQRKFAEDVCEGVRGHMMKDDWETVIQKTHYKDAHKNTYAYSIFWDKGCMTNATERNAFKPMADGLNCTQLFTRDYTHCKCALSRFVLFACCC